MYYINAICFVKAIVFIHLIPVTMMLSGDMKTMGGDMDVVGGAQDILAAGVEDIFTSVY